MASCSSPPTLTEVKKCFADVDSTALNEFIDTIKKILETKMASKYEIDNPSTSFESTNEWNLLILSGKTFWCFLDPQEQFGQTVDLFQSRTQVLSVISSILEGLGQIHWAVAGLSMIGYLLKKVGPLSNNRDDCLQLLQYMLDIVYHMNKLGRLFPEEKEKLKSALVIIVKGSMLCAKQLSSNAHFSYLKVSLDSTSLSSLLSEMNAFYRDFLLTTQIAALEGQPQRMPIKKPDSTANEERYTEVENLLDMEPKDLSFRAVIIYGLGGIGKTFIANAVYSRLNLDSYNHTRIVMDTDPQKNDIKKMQEQILNDAFPQYNSRKIKLRNEQEGRELLTEAFKETNKPVFLFIDNALRSDDLKKLLPEHLELSGKNIRLLLTRRNLNAMYMFRKRFRHEYLVKPLLKSDAEKILWNGTNNPPLDTGDFVRILKICNGVPLVLQIVGAHLENQEYKVENCSLILNALKKGDEIKENKLSECLVDLVFKELDKPIQEAFLDICCFLDGESRRRVEFVVGAMELKALEGAALIAYKPEKEIVVLDPLIKARGQNMAQSTRITDIKSFETAVEEKRLQNIKGISLSGNRGSDYELKTEDLDSMSKTLRVFILKRYIKVRARSGMTFPELRYVYLSSSIPFVPFNLENVKPLAVYTGPLLEESFRINEWPETLRSVKATAMDWTVKDIETRNSSLEELILVNLQKMITLPEGFQNFTALKTLNLDTLEALKCLPTRFGKLTTLEHLTLKFCSGLKKMPDTIVELKNLRYLNLEGCSSLTQLPSTFGKLKALQSLTLKACSSLKELPGFEDLAELKYLNVEDCPVRDCDFSKKARGLKIVGLKKKTEIGSK